MIGSSTAAMAKLCGGIAFVIVCVSWLAAIAVGLGVEYIGWHKVIAEHDVGVGLAIALLAAPPAFMTTQTILGLVAIPFGLLAERLSPSEDSIAAVDY